MGISGQPPHCRQPDVGKPDQSLKKSGCFACGLVCWSCVAARGSLLLPLRAVMCRATIGTTGIRMAMYGSQRAWGHTLLTHIHRPAGHGSVSCEPANSTTDITLSEGSEKLVLCLLSAAV